MTHPESPDEHVFVDPEEALRHFTDEAMAAAQPRTMTLDEFGNRVPDGPESDEPSERDATS